MASTYTTNLGIEKIATGEQSGTWGNTTNTNLDLIDQAINGIVQITAAATGSTGSPNALTITNGSASDGRNKFIDFYSPTDLGGTVYYQLDPNDAEKIVFVRNSLGGGQTLVLFQGTYNASNDVEVPNGVDMLVKFDGTGASATVTNVFEKLQVNALVATQVDITAQGDLRLQDTTGGQYVALQAPGTIATSYTLTLPVDDGTNGQALTTDGSGVLSWADAGGVTGPVSSTDNAIARYDSTTGALIQNSGVTIDDSNNVSGVGTIATTGDATINGLTVGEGAGSYNTNVAVGQSALTSNTFGCGNTAVGTNALCSNTTTCCSTAVGHNALANSNTISGAHNTAVGASALFCSTTGANNTAVGGFALLCNTSGFSNTAVGASALLKNTTSTGNSALGSFALTCNTTGANNTAVGASALTCNTTASNNTAVGASALLKNTGTDNTALGSFALACNTAAVENTAVGSCALCKNTTGNDNIAVGYHALICNTTGASNIALGSFALCCNTTGLSNTAVGDSALTSNTTGRDNTAVGASALYYNTGKCNTAVGASALYYNDTGCYNTSVGYYANPGNDTGCYNTAVGAESMAANDGSACGNTAVGYGTLNGIFISGFNNTAVGRSSGATITDGNNLTVLGFEAEPSSASATNQVTLGNASVTCLRIPGVGLCFSTTDGFIVPKTITAVATTGAQTINKTAGSVNFAAAATSLVVTNSFVDANSVILATVATNDTTMKSVAAVASAGSFTLHANAGATAETRVNWFVVN